MMDRQIGLIADTHGLLRPEAVRGLAGVDLIIHAGDIGAPRVITELEQIAPVVAVRGNCDREPWAETYPPTQFVEVGSFVIYAIHQIDRLDLDPAAAGIGLVVYGHSHRPAQAIRDGIWYVNPGGAGPRRFSLPVTVARLKINRDGLDLKFVNLSI